MELMLDTANLEQLNYYLDIYPICGITSNPSILKKEGSIDFFKHMKQVKELAGTNRSLHIQVITENCEDIIKEAEKILEVVGKDTYIKIPVTEQGIKAMKRLSEKGVNITATAVYTTLQGMLAILAGAKYVAVYYNRMQNIDIDSNKVIYELSEIVNKNGFDCKIISASFKNIGQVVQAFCNGAHSATVPPELLTEGLSMPSIQKAVTDFKKDWETIHGENSTILNV